MTRSLLIVVSFAVSGCVHGFEYWGHFKPEHKKEPGEVVYVGRVIVRPSIEPVRTPCFGDPIAKVFPRMVLFTDTPEHQLDFNSQVGIADADRFAGVSDDGFFVVQYDIHRIFLRALRIYVDCELGSTAGMASVTHYVFYCPFDVQIDSGRDDYVYAGSFVCETQDGVATGSSVFDEYDALAPHWKRLLGDQVPAKRVGVDLRRLPRKGR